MLRNPHTARTDAGPRRGRLSHARVALFVIGVVAALSGMLAPAASASSDGAFGMNPGDLFKLPQSQWDAHLTAMSADGIEVVRMGAWWSDLEPSAPVDGQHRYSWSELDVRVAALARHGLRWEPLLCFSPTWGSKVPGDYTAAPASNEDFASFAAALARRYGRGGSFWNEHPELPALPVTAYEIWNEQNAPQYWHPAANAAADYADLYAAGHDAIHQVDDAARVLVGGLAATIDGVVPADEFLRRMFAHRPDLRGHVDAVAFHPYARDVQGVYSKIADFRHALDAIAGPGLPLELTEIGWSSSNTPEAQRAANLATLTTTLPRSDCGIERVMPYAWIGPEQNSADSEQWFGIVNPDATPKPAAVAFANAVRQMHGAAGASGTPAICNARSQASPPPPPQAPARQRARRLRLKLRVAQSRRHPNRLRLIAHCPAGCRLRVELLMPARTASATSNVSLAKRTTSFTSRPRALTLRLANRSARRGTRIQVKVIAIARDGRQTRMTRTVRLRRSAGGRRGIRA